MKVLTIIVSYNFEPWIDRCLGSLKASTLPTDVIVIDNGSSDRTVDIIRNSYPGIRLITNHANLGFGKANNIGMQIALKEGYDAVFLLNQDAWIGQDTLEALARQSQLHPKFGILSPVHLNGSGKELEKGFASYTRINTRQELPAGNEPVACTFINAAFWFIPVSTLRTVGGFSPLFYHYGEDKDYANRIHFHRFQIGYLPSVSGCHDREFRKVSLEGFLLGRTCLPALGIRQHQLQLSAGLCLRSPGRREKTDYGTVERKLDTCQRICPDMPLSDRPECRRVPYTPTDQTNISQLS